MRDHIYLFNHRDNFEVPDMPTFSKYWLAVCLLLSYFVILPFAQADAYLISPEDELEISVWKEVDLQKQVLVRPDGKLSFPLVGHIQAAGKTPEEVEQEITKRLEKYIPSPVVTVTLMKVAGNKIYVIGKVSKPGGYNVGGYVDVMQALSLAGGLATYASANSIKVLRRENGKQISLPFKYSQVEDGENLQQNIQLKSGDVVVVP